MTTKTYSECREITTHPGKFQHAHPLAVLLYDASLNGDGDIIADMDTDGHFAAEFYISGSEREEFGWNHSKAILVEQSDGFVTLLTPEQYRNWI